MSVVIKDRLPQFRRNAINVLDQALKEGARDVLIAAKTRSPFDKGGLRSSSETKRRTILSWRISFWKEYARYQEAGGDGNRTVRKYSTPGTGAHYLEKSGDEVAKRIAGIFKKHGMRAR